jgi:hypothetical protein
MDSLDGVGVALVEAVALFDVAPVVGAVPFCWAHSLKTDWAWIGIGIGLDWDWMA